MGELAGAVREASDPAEGLLIRAEVENITVEVHMESDNSPHNCETFFLRESVVFLRARTSAAPTSDR